ncbi:tetratricopeptide repeat protein [Hymenobacter daeguensis]
MATLQPLNARNQEIDRAWQLLKLHRPALALSVCARLLAQNPANVSALLAKTEALWQLKRFSEAAMTAREAVAHAPASALPYYYWARMLGAQGVLYDAEAAARNAIQLAPSNAEYWGLLAQLQCMLRQPREALASANEGLALNARHVGCLLWRAVASERTGNISLAEEGFQEVLRLAPTDAQVHALRGQTLLQRPEPQAASWYLAEALRLDPTRYELMPLLRQARRWQHWPKWMVQRHQRMRKNWYQERYLGYADSSTALLLLFFLPISWLHNRHDPLFQSTPTQVWRRWLGLWVSLPLLALAILFLADWLGWVDTSRPFSMPQMVGLLIGGSLFYLVILLLKRKIDSTLSP